MITHVPKMNVYTNQTTHKYMRRYVFIYTYRYGCMCMYRFMYRYMHVMDVHLYIHELINVYNLSYDGIRTHIHVCMYACTSTHTWIQTRIRPHIVLCMHNIDHVKINEKVSNLYEKNQVSTFMSTHILSVFPIGRFWSLSLSTHILGRFRSKVR